MTFVLRELQDMATLCTLATTYQICKVFVGIHTFYESRTVVESQYIDGQQIDSLSGYSEAGIRNIYVN